MCVRGELRAEGGSEEIGIVDILLRESERR